MDDRVIGDGTILSIIHNPSPIPLFEGLAYLSRIM
jgi:hypothetical protein